MSTFSFPRVTPTRPGGPARSTTPQVPLPDDHFPDDEQQQISSIMFIRGATYLLFVRHLKTWQVLFKCYSCGRPLPCKLRSKENSRGFILCCVLGVGG
jgi:hypothetical protein